MLERSEQQIRAASGLEELLQITHFEDWKLWRCRLKLKSLTSSDSRSSPHRSTRFAATFYDIETLKVIDEEWQRTQCSPRETCVEVASELGRSTDTFFKPPCVNVFRCGGCCNEESLVCVNTSTSYVSKQIAAEKFRKKMKFMQNKQLKNTLLDSQKFHYIAKEHAPLQELALCGPHMKFDEDRCECVCKTPCPRDLVQHPENCSCIECRESLESCCQKHKTFHPDTCR
ncbi:vascular endothelial growth factor D [Camelus ferus]|nr:vascular endothelial growth factor D [Camelus ferus]